MSDAGSDAGSAKSDKSAAKSDAAGSAKGEAAVKEDKFPGCESKRVRVTSIPEKCNWSQIRKMFAGSARIQNGKVDPGAGTAFVEFDAPEVAREKATAFEGCTFEDEQWVVAFQLPNRDDFPKKAKPAGAYGGAPQKSYGRFPNEPAFKVGSKRGDGDYDYGHRRRDDYHDRRRRNEQDEERNRRDNDDRRGRSRRDRSRSRDRSRRDRSRSRDRRRR